MGKYTKKIIVLIVLGVLVACSPTRRFNRLINKYPYLITQDTVKQIDTVVISVPKVKVDSVIQIDSFLIDLHDTIIIEKERLKIELFRVKDSIIVNGNCDTVYLEKIIERKIPVKYYEKFNKWSVKNIALLILGGLFFLMLLFVFIKFIQLFK